MPSMHAVQIHRYGGPDVLSFEEAPRPTAGPGEVLVRVYATSVTITRPVVIEGAGESPRLDGGGFDRATRVVVVEDAAPVERRNLALVNGDAGFLPGGALFNSGTETLTSVLVRGNAGLNAGAIRNVGTLTIIISTSALSLVNTAVVGNTSPTGPTVNIFQGTALVESSGIMDNSGEDSAESLPAGLLANPGTTVTLKGTALLRNGPGTNCQGTITSQGGNLSDDAPCGAAAATVQTQLFLPALQQ